MGHPKTRKKTYSKPTHPWEKERIEEEKELLSEFGLKNKKEVWKVDSLLRKYAKQAKKLITLHTLQAEKERVLLIKKLSSLGLIGETAKLEDVLTITLKDILNRRLQTVIYKNKLSKSVRQARQFITHGHINVGDKKITVPSYLVSKQEEPLVNFTPSSSLFNQEHPERVMEKEPAKKVSKEEKKHNQSKEKPDTGKKDKKPKEKPDTGKESNKTQKNESNKKK